MIVQLNLIAETWWTWSVSMFWQVSLLIVIVGCIDALLRRWAWPHLRYALWLMVLVKLIIPPTLHLSSSVIARVQPTVTQWMVSSAAEPSPTVIPPAVVDSTPLFKNVSTPTVVLIASEPTTAAAPVIAPIARSRTPLTWKAVGMLLWLTGIVCLGSWLVRKLWILRRNDRKEPPLPESFHLLASQCAARLCMRSRPRFVVTSRVRVPAVMGVFRPVLLMPSGFLAHLSRQDTEHMLLHEFAHIQRGDLQVHGLTLLLQILYWYHPLLWLVTRQMHHLRELCCDATVARHLRERVLGYRQTLLDVARRHLARPLEPGLGLLGLFEDSNRLAVRLAWLKRKTWRYPRTRCLLILVLIAIMGVCVLPMAQAGPAPTENPKEAKQKDPGQALETLLSDFNHQKAKLKAELGRLHQHTGQYKNRQQIVHVVQPGDTLAAIARKFYGRDIKLKEAVAAIKQANPGLTDSGLRPKQVLQIPAHPAKKLPTSNLGPTQPDRDWEEELDHWLKQMQAWSDELSRTVQELNVEDRLQKAHTWKQDFLNHEAINQWQQDLSAWQESEEFRNWQQDIQAWGQKIERFVHGKVSDHTDPNSTPVPMPAMPTLPRLPAPPRPVSPPGTPIATPAPSIVGVPEAKPHERHRFEVVTKEEFTSPAHAGINIYNPHGNITIRGHENGSARTAISLLVGGCSRTEAEKLMGPTIEAIASQNSQKALQVTVELPENNDRQNLSVDIEVSLPAGIPVEARTNMGAIGLENLSADTKAKTNMGVITARNVTGDTECRSNMGAIRFITPEDPSIQVTASTNLGSLHTDLSLEKESGGSNALKGQLGSGAERVVLRTNMGSIHIGTESFIETQTAKDKTRHKSKKEADTGSVAASVISPATPSAPTRSKPVIPAAIKPGAPIATGITQQDNRFVASRSIDLAFVYKPDLPIAVKNRDGSITVTGADDQNCTIQGEIRCLAPSEQAARNLLGQIDLTPETSDKGLLIQPTLKQKPTRDQRVTVDLTIELPQDTILTITHEDGSVRVKDMRGPVRITHEDGAIQCYRLQGPLAIRHEDGHIQIEDPQGPLDIKLEDGFISVRNVSADLDIKLEDGTVKLDCSPQAKALHSIKTSVLDGTIKLNIPQNLLGTESLPQVQRKDSRARWRHGTDTLDIDLRVNDGSIKINRE